jgi:hypothetical protein
MPITPSLDDSPEIPHVPFELDNSEDLRRVLESLVSAKRMDSEAVVARSWEAWTLEHRKLFDALEASSPRTAD